MLPESSLPVKTARPSAAETPHRNAAEAMKKYPRRGCGCWLRLVGLEMVVLADGFDDQAAESKRSRRSGSKPSITSTPECREDHQSWGSLAAIDLEQFEAGGGVELHIPLFKRKTLGLEKNSHDSAGETAGLGEEQNSVSHETFRRSSRLTASNDLRIRFRW